ncbi:MAG: hypothetical protein HOJ79_05975 [Nitrospina sp.]|nr:hypothetical protein [Nitrospina sp.]
MSADSEKSLLELLWAPLMLALAGFLLNLALANYQERAKEKELELKIIDSVNVLVKNQMENDSTVCRQTNLHQELYLARDTFGL